MKRTSIMLPDDVDSRLRLEARRRGVSIADVAREAIEQFLPAETSTGRLSFFGIGRGGPADASEQVDVLVASAIVGRHSSGRSRTDRTSAKKP